MQRFLVSDRGPVPITADMTPRQQEIVRACNAGVLELQRTKKTFTKRKSTQFKWHFEDRFRLGQMYDSAQKKGHVLKEARAINPDVNESTLRSFAKAYRERVKADPSVQNKITGWLPHKKRGKPLKFGKHDREICEYVRMLRKHGTRVNRAVVIGSAMGLLKKKAPNLQNPLAAKAL